MTKPKKQGEYKITEAQLLLAVHLRELGLLPFYERKVCGDRDWRFDVCCPDNLLAFEINGGKHTGGHRRGEAQDDEYEKLNYAQMLGWKVLQFSNEAVLDGRAQAFVADWLK